MEEAGAEEGAVSEGGATEFSEVAASSDLGRRAAGRRIGWGGGGEFSGVSPPAPVPATDLETWTEPPAETGNTSNACTWTRLIQCD